MLLNVENRNGVTEKEQRTGWMDLCHEDDEAVKFAPDQSGPAPTGSDPVTQFGHRMSGHCSKYCSSLQLVKDNARPAMTQLTPIKLSLEREYRV